MKMTTPNSSSDYTLTRQEAEYLRRSNSYKPSLFDIHLVESHNPNPDNENVLNTRSGDSVVRCRSIRVRGSSQEERKASLFMTIRQTRRWRKMSPHPCVLDIKGLDVADSDFRDGSEDSISYLRLVSECPTYTIIEYLNTHPQADRMKLCIDIAAGLDHVHCHAIVHGAIRPSNILVTSDGTACLGEFSDEHIPSVQTIALYGSYTAPELVDIERLHKLLIDNYRSTDYKGEYKMESDIFALGCCMIEIYTGAPPNEQRVPYDRVKTHQELAKLRREPTSQERSMIPAKLLSTIQAMLRYVPHFRVNSSVVYSWLMDPDSLRLGPTIPVFAKGRVWGAFRQMTRSSKLS